MFHLSKITKGVALAALLVSSAQAQVSNFKSVGYFPSWSGSVQQVQYDKLTHINYSFLLLNTDGSLKPIASPQKLSTMVQLSHQHGVKAGIAIGGWNGSRANEFENMSATAYGRTKFVRDVMAFVEQYNLDGVDMDWEYPDSGVTADNFALLMDELSLELHSRGKYLTAAVAASGWGGRGVKREVFDDVDFLNLMAYDAPHSNGQHHSSYQMAEQSIAYWQGKGLPKEKTVLGVPFYSQPAKAYKDIVASEANAACKDVTNSGAGYNGIPTIQKKTRLALEKAGGIMNWELSQDTHDHTSLLTAIDQAINGQISNVCNGGTPPTSGITKAWVAGQYYNAGDKVSYQGKVYQATHGNPGYNPTESTWFWKAVGSTVTPPKPTTPPTLPPTPGGDSWVSGQYYNAGDKVTYQGKTYQATHGNPGYNPTESTWFWKAVGSTVTPPTPTSPPTLPPTPGDNSWVSGQYYNAGDKVIYQGKTYQATNANPGYNPTQSTWFWKVVGSSVTPPTPTVANWVSGKYYEAGSKVSYQGRTYQAANSNPGYNPAISSWFWSAL